VVFSITVQFVIFIQISQCRHFYGHYTEKKIDIELKKKLLLQTKTFRTV